MIPQRFAEALGPITKVGLAEIRLSAYGAGRKGSGRRGLSGQRQSLVPEFALGRGEGREQKARFARVNGKLGFDAVDLRVHRLHVVRHSIEASDQTVRPAR